MNYQDNKDQHVLKYITSQDVVVIINIIITSSMHGNSTVFLF